LFDNFRLDHFVWNEKTVFKRGYLKMLNMFMDGWMDRWTDVKDDLRIAYRQGIL
jgi:hypothetical protein